MFEQRFDEMAKKCIEALERASQDGSRSSKSTAEQLVRDLLNKHPDIATRLVEINHDHKFLNTDRTMVTSLAYAAEMYGYDSLSMDIISKDPDILNETIYYEKVYVPEENTYVTSVKRTFASMALENLDGVGNGFKLNPNTEKILSLVFEKPELREALLVNNNTSSPETELVSIIQKHPELIGYKDKLISYLPDVTKQTRKELENRDKQIREERDNNSIKISR